MLSVSSMRPGRSVPGSASPTTGRHRKLIAGLRAAGVSEAAIERSDGVLVAALLDAGLTVVVITSRQMKNLRSRYGSAGAKDDRFDALSWLTCCARTVPGCARWPRTRLRPSPCARLCAPAVTWLPTASRRATSCAPTWPRRSPPGPGCSRDLDGPISLAFLARFGSQDAAGQLSEADLAAWLQTLPHRGNAARPEQLRARLQAAPRGATGADGAARAAITGALVPP